MRKVNHAIEFIETSIFTSQIKQMTTDDDLKNLQKERIESPDKGRLIKNTGGLKDNLTDQEKADLKKQAKLLKSEM